MLRACFAALALLLLVVSVFSGTAADDGVSFAMFVLLAIYDRKTESYGPLVQERSKAAAVRSLGDEMRNAKNVQLVQHARDFELHAFGEFDETCGVLTPYPEPQLVIAAEAVVRQLRADQAELEAELSDDSVEVGA